MSRPRQYTFRDPDNIECDTSDYSSRNITRTDRDQPGYDVNGNVSYTRSLSKRSRLSFEYRINYTDNSVERNTFVLTKENVFPDERNPKQSTEYDYAYLTHRIGSTYQYYFKRRRSPERSTTSTPPSAATTPSPMRGRPRRRSTT